MRDSSVPPHPPADPQPALARAGKGVSPLDARPIRVQLVVASCLGVALIGVGLYLWRRPHAAPDPQASDDPETAASAGASPGEPPGPPLAEAGAPSPVSLSDLKVLGCHDRGPKVTPVDQCDHLAPIEKALSNAVVDAASCVPASAAGGTIEYVADVSFSRHKVRVSMPRSGRSEHDRKVVSGCGTAIREAMHALELDGIEHQHARYEIAVTASYRGHG